MNAEHWQKVKDLFDAVVELAPVERERLLDQSCGTDYSLRRAVENLLDSFENAESFLEQPAAAEVASVIVEGEAKNLEAGKCFGHYEILRQIGAGGMGEVYLAQDKKLDRQVAVKILNEKFSRDESNLQRFTREAKAASALNHPNILVIHEIGEADEANYIVSEFIEGETLREIINQSPMKLPEALDIAVQIAGALTAAHAAQIVHRDIKPENIMIRPDGYVKILDFGLAKLVEQKVIGLEDETARQNETAKGVILGTVNYMSPEQAKGERVDRRTDIFSCGVLVYEMIAAKTPFAANTMSETFANLINAEPQPLARYAEGVPDELQRIVSKMLRKNKNERYQTAKDLLIDLKSLQKRIEFEAELLRDRETGRRGEGENVTKIQPSPLLPVSSSPHLNSVAVMPFANMSNDAENEYFCDGLAEELLNALAKIDDLNVAARTSAFSFKGKNTNVSEIGNILNVNTILEGSVRKSDNRLRITVQLINVSDGYHLWSERYDREMRDIFDVQDEITLAVVDALKIKLLGGEKAAVLKRYTNKPEAYQLFLKGRYHWYKQTPENIGKSRDYFQQAIELDPAYAPGYAGLSEFYGIAAALGMMPPNEGWQKSEAAMVKAQELDDALPEIHNGLAAIRMIYYRDTDGAGREIRRAIELNPNFAEVYHLHAVCLVAVGRLDDAIKEQRRALELDPLSFSYQRYLGNWLYFARRYDEAIAKYHQALELDANSAPVYEELGNAYEQKEMHGEAIASWRQAMTLVGDDELSAVLDNAYAESGFGGAVRAVGRKRLERFDEKRKRGEYVPTIEYARLYIRLGDKERAFHWLEMAVEERNVFPLWMNSDPFYDRLRSDPRFQDLLRRVGLPTNQNARGKTTNEAGKEISETKTTTDLTAQSQTRGSFAADNRQNQKYVLIGGLIIFLLTAVGFGYYFWTGNESVSTATGKKSLAVLPFVNAGQDANAEYLSDGITESIINNLSQLAGLRVMSRNSAFRFKQNQTDTKNIAAQLGVEALVTGDIKQLGDKLVINVRLIDPSDDSQIWGNQYVKTSADLIAAQNEIAQAVATNLRGKLSNSEQQQLVKRYTDNVEAYQLYLKGRYHIFKLTPPEIQRGMAYFKQAIEIDPGYALAYVGLSDAYRSFALSGETPATEVLPKAKAAANKALEIDDRLAEAHSSLSSITFWYDWDWNAAENHIKRALELSPNNADAHFFYAYILSNTGRHTEALAEAKRAGELDSLSLVINTFEGQFLLHAGQTDEALAKLQKTFELDANFAPAHLVASSIYIEKGMYAEAVAAARKTRELNLTSSQPAAFLCYALVKSGRPAEARDELERLLKSSTERYVSPYAIALIYNGLNDPDETFAWLERGFEKRDPRMTFLKIEPKWNNLRSEPRFVSLLKRMNLE